MTLPSFVAAGAVAADVAAITPGLPAGHQLNDILLLFLETEGTAITVTGWTAVADSPQASGASASDTRLSIFWKRDNGSESAPTTSDSGDHQVGRIIAVRGCIATGNPWDVTSGGVDATAGTTITIPGDTTTVADCLVIVAAAVSLPASTGTANFSSWTNADLANLTERIDNTTGQGSGGGIGVATGEKAAAGAYGATTVTCGNARRAMISIALKPPSSGETMFLGDIPF